MPKTKNEVNLHGFVYGEPKISHYDNGKKVANFLIKTYSNKATAAGVEKEAELHRCVVWGDRAPDFESTLIEGNFVYAQGSLRTTKYQNQNQEWVYSTQIICGELHLLCRKPKNFK